MLDMADEPLVNDKEAAALWSAQNGNRNICEVLNDIIAGLKLKSTAPQAVQHLRHMVRLHEREVLESHTINLLGSIIKESAALPIGCAAMDILNTLATSPTGRVQVRSEAGIAPVVRYLSSADVANPSTEAAVRLLLSLAPDKLARRHICKDGGIEALVRVLRLGPQGSLAVSVAGAVANLVVTEDTDAKQRFVAANGIEAACKALSERSKDAPACCMRLRLLLSELARTQPQYEVQISDAAFDFPAQGAPLARAPTAPVAVLKADASAVQEQQQQQEQQEAQDGQPPESLEVQDSTEAALQLP